MKLTIDIDLPERTEILDSGCPVPIARKGELWSESCLGEMRDKRGVYVIHHNGQIKYVGKTDGPTMYFARRLRREFREQSSQGKHNFPKLSALQTPPHIMVRCFPSDDICQRVKFNGEVPRIDKMIAVFEIAMINYLEPEFQQYYMKATVKQIQKVLRIELGREPRADDFKTFLNSIPITKK